MYKYLIGASVCLFSVNALAEPVYLECLVGSDDSETKFSVKVDENSGKITHSQKGGFAFNSQGFFAVNKITYQKIDLFSGIKMVRRYEISRVDLSASINTETTSIEFPDKIKPLHLSSKGNCEVVKVQERKF